MQEIFLFNLTPAQRTAEMYPMPADDQQSAEGRRV